LRLRLRGTAGEERFWIRVKQSAEVEPMRRGYDWQVGQPRVECWDRTVREELDTIGLDYIRQNAREAEIRSMCHIIKLRCADVQRQSWLAEMRENILCQYTRI